MYNVKTSTDLNLLYDKGILLSSGEICKNKINLISGTITTPFVDAIWIFTEKDAEAMDRIISFLDHLYHKGLETEMMVLLRILSDILGLQLPEDIELIREHSEAQEYFLFSFLLDMEECMQEFIAGL